MTTTRKRKTPATNTQRAKKFSERNMDVLKEANPVLIDDEETEVESHTETPRFEDSKLIWKTISFSTPDLEDKFTQFNLGHRTIIFDNARLVRKLDTMTDDIKKSLAAEMEGLKVLVAELKDSVVSSLKGMGSGLGSTQAGAEKENLENLADAANAEVTVAVLENVTNGQDDDENPV